MNGAPALNPARLVANSEPVAVDGPPPVYVGRGGQKLEAALRAFELDLTDKRVLDVGSSTGGFTDCALQAGAMQVIAVDVGRGQLHQRLRTDERVEVRERTNVRSLGPGDLRQGPDVAVADLSFISLRAVAATILGLCATDADLLWLVKPQFEATRAEADAGRGVIADPEIWRRVLFQVCDTLAGLGAAIMGLVTSPIHGADGNTEFFVHARIGGRGFTGPPLTRILDDVIEQARCR